MKKMKPIIRQAEEFDVAEIERVVHAAYEHYIPRIGKPPAPMTDDYHLQVARGNVWVVVLAEEIVGLVVLTPAADHMLLDNVAVRPERQGSGLGRLLIDFAESRTRQCCYREIQLYTNELMHENLALYKKLGYQETSRGLNSGFKRVFLKKTL
jgi:ribosomal protein S18 acetylase RimI-like enzyme